MEFPNCYWAYNFKLFLSLLSLNCLSAIGGEKIDEHLEHRQIYPFFLWGADDTILKEKLWMYQWKVT